MSNVKTYRFCRSILQTEYSPVVLYVATSGKQVRKAGDAVIRLVANQSTAKTCQYSQSIVFCRKDYTNLIFCNFLWK